MVVDGFFRLWSRGHIRSHRRTRLDQLAFPVELQAVAPQPAGATGATLGLGELATLPKSCNRQQSVLNDIKDETKSRVVGQSEQGWSLSPL